MRLLHFGVAPAFVAAMISPSLAQTTDVVFVIPNPSAINILPVTVALGEGYFEDEGLNVQIEALNGSGPVLQALTAGQGHIGNPGAGPFLGARARGIDITFLYRLNPNSSYGMVVQGDSDIQSPTDLKGKTVGIGTADGAEAAFARSIFTEAGMQEGTDYDFLIVGDGGMAAAGFMRSDIDAYVAATSDAAILNSRGLKLRNITPEKFRSFFGNGMAAMTAFVEQNPETVEKFGRAAVKGAIFAANPDNIEAVLDHTTALNPQESEDREFARALIEQIVLRQTPFDPSKGYGYQDHAAWVAWQDSLVASGEMEAPLEDLEAVYTNEFVPAWNTQ